MKKYILLLILFSFVTPVFAVLPPDASIIQVHDMQMINQQRFRIEEINDYNDVQTEKERYQKKTVPNREPVITKFFNKKKFVEDNGEIKIESDSDN